MNPNLGLVKRFNKREAERSAQISNDIAEGIDNHDSVQALRTAVAYYSDLAVVAEQRAARAETKLVLARVAKTWLDLAAEGEPVHKKKAVRYKIKR